MRRILSFSLTLILIFCSLCCTDARSKKASPLDTVDAFSQAMQLLDFDTMASHLKHPGELEDLSGIKDPTVQTLLPLFQAWAKEMTYTAKEPRIDKNSATVSVTYHYVDGSEVIPNAMTAYYAKALDLALTGADQAAIDALLPELILEQAQQADLKQADIDVTYSLEYADEKWIISSMPAELVRPLTGDFLLLADDISAMLQGVNP